MYQTLKFGRHTFKVNSKRTKDAHLIPYGHLPSLNPTGLKHLDWMLSKHSLDQDLHLLSPPTSYPLTLASSFAETLNLPLYHFPLTSETVSSDLKLRRELINSSTTFSSSSVVSAAVSGGVLFLDGIHRAERNVLPVLNNLLENREINLDDGRSIISSQRYDQIKKEHGVREDLVRCSEDFRVVASSIPWEVYGGQSLDPPLRSRMQVKQKFSFLMR